ncbi:gamma carbonic anhydrase family protein [Geomonas ferrireducens]|uniref:gamma carbonic anhydrase family protein n=1 Tax=Geomonas ferrireducens TaxID=2570227 RepID=UPI0010A81C9E|nr:gamma carbonic anhydrase family protein [Geomonas ferrireducens]
MIRSFKGMNPKIDPSAFIAEGAVIIGEVSIGKEASIWYNCVVRGDVNSITIGDRTNIQDLSMLHVTHKKHAEDPGAPLVIGNDVTVGHSVTLHGCTIEDGAFIGMQAMIMDKAVIGKGALVGARALVTEGTVIPPGTLWVGSPAKYKRDLTENEIAWLGRSAGNYVRYSREFMEDPATPRRTDNE